ncbi:MAG TPA: hypothetical protein VK403_14440 [Allosphingosinicella sp.]|nr:hypothetical protein [Allosphingosinicella sp.]
MSFLNYIHTRRYNFGRGAESSWAFIAAARGDPDFPDTRSWRELRDYLVESDMDDMLDAASVVWRTYQRRVQKGEFALPDPAPWAGLQRDPDAARAGRRRDSRQPPEFSLQQLG